MSYTVWKLFKNVLNPLSHLFNCVSVFHLQMTTVTKAPLQIPPHWSRRTATTLVLHLNPWQLLRVTAMTWKVTNILPNSLLLVRIIRVVSHCNESYKLTILSSLSFDVYFNFTFLFSEQNHCSSESRTAKRDGKSQGDSEHFLDSSKSAQVHANRVTCMKVEKKVK